MKKISIFAFFMLFALVASAQDSSGMYLTNQAGTKTTQFEKTDSIYIAGLCPAASGELAKIYITNDKKWTDNDGLSDISAGIESVDVPANAEIPRTLIWKYLHDDGAYDVVVDANKNLKLDDVERACVIGIDGAGFLIGAGAPPPPPPPPPPPLPPTPPPSPTPSPAPAPAPASQPSQNFSLNSYVTVKSLSNVREIPGGTLVGEQTDGAIGQVVGGPVLAKLKGTSYWFWNINFENDPDGWVAESTLKSTTKPEPTEEPKTTESNDIPVAGAALEPAVEVMEITPPKQTPIDTTVLAQTAQATDVFGTNSLMDAAVIGIAILVGLIAGSWIISRAIGRNRI